MTNLPTPGISPTRRIVYQAGWSGVGQLLGLLLRYGLALSIARLLGAPGLGLYTLAIAFGSGAALLGRAGLDQAALRFTALYSRQGDHRSVEGVLRLTSALTLLFSTLLALALEAASGPIATVWDEPGAGEASRMIALAVPAIALGEVWRDALRGFHDVRLATLVEQVGIPITTLAGIGLAAAAWGALAPVAAAVASYWLMALVAGFALLRTRPVVVSKPVFRPRTWLPFALLLSLESGILFLLQWSDQLLIGAFMSAADVGVYAAALRLGTLVSVPLLAVNAILGPTIAGLAAEGERGQLRLLYARFTWATAAGGAGIGGSLVLVGPALLGFFGPEFVIAYPVLVVIVLGQLVNASTGSAGLLLGMTGHARWRLVNAIASAALNISLNLVLIPALGILGSAVATAIAIVTINLLQVIEVRAVLGFWGYDPRELVYWTTKARAGISLLMGRS